MPTSLRAVDAAAKPDYDHRMELCIHNGGVPYRPEYWNGEIQYRTNCYSYAVHFPHEWLHPGSFEKGAPWRFYKRNSATTGLNFKIADGMRQALQQGGLVPLALGRNGGMPQAPDGHFIIAAVIDPQRDFHFYLKHHDGSWSHKEGYACATLRHQASDPRRFCEADGYPEFVGFYAVSANLVRRREEEASSPWWEGHPSHQEQTLTDMVENLPTV